MLFVFEKGIRSFLNKQFCLFIWFLLFFKCLQTGDKYFSCNFVPDFFIFIFFVVVVADFPVVHVFQGMLL